MAVSLTRERAEAILKAKKALDKRNENNKAKLSIPTTFTPQSFLCFILFYRSSPANDAYLPQLRLKSSR